MHTYAVRLSLVEALKAPLCSDRSVLLLEFDERPEIGIQVEGNLKLEEKLSVSIRRRIVMYQVEVTWLELRRGY